MKKTTQWGQSLLKSIQLQLFISFISLPFLIGWGLPISLLSPISTLAFGPFLTCFLLISSLIFFLELFYLPNDTLIWCLEIVTSAWMACLSLEQRAWLIAFAKPPVIILICLPLIALAAVHYKHITSVKIRITLLSLLLVSSCATLKLFPYKYATIETITCNNGSITLIKHNNTLVMIDPAFMAARPSYESFISYTLLPELVQKTGRLQIDHLIVFKFNKRILDALQFLASKVTIKNIYMPFWHGRISSFAWRSYAHLKKTMIANNGKLIPISYIKKLPLDATSLLFIEPAHTKEVSYYEATYKPLTVKGVVNQLPITF